MNPGSTVTRPVSRNREETTMPSFPSVAGTTGSSRVTSPTVSWTGFVTVSGIQLLLAARSNADDRGRDRVSAAIIGVRASRKEELYAGHRHEACPTDRRRRHP